MTKLKCTESEIERIVAKMKFEYNNFPYGDFYMSINHTTCVGKTEPCHIRIWLPHI